MNTHLRTIAVGFGSNVGDRLQYISEAVRRLQNLGLSAVKSSSIYETPPWGMLDQPAFLNAVVLYESDFPVTSLLPLFKELELQLGRKPRMRYGPREIDIDLLCAGSEIVTEKEITVPHPHLHERSFVLVPLCEVWPEWMHPVLGKTILELSNDFEARIVAAPLF